MFFIKSIMFILVLMQIKFATSSKAICETADMKSWPLNHVFTNALFTGQDVKYITTNSTSLEDCKNECCMKLDCNYVFFKEMKECFLIMCPSEESCRLIDNFNKPKEDPKMDFILKIRSVDMFQPLINKFVQQETQKLLPQQQIPQQQIPQQQIPQQQIPQQQISQQQISQQQIPQPQMPQQQTPQQQIQQQPETAMKSKLELQQLPREELNNQLNTCLLDKTSSPENKCPINQVCLIKDKQLVCVCPEELNLRMIDGVCREIYDSMLGCTMYLNECTSGPNEECVALNSFSKHGTCQCKLGFRRNPENLKCEIEKKATESNNKAKKLNNRRRPSLTFDDNKGSNSNYDNNQGSINNILNDKNFEPLIQEIYDELSQEENVKNENRPSIVDEPSSTAKILESSTKSEQELFSSSNKPTRSSSISTATIPTTTSRIYEPPSLYTETLKANAGRDIHVYYPSTMCILNGTLTNFFTKNPYDYFITKWEWIKLETSPAFGEFVKTNQGPIVIYEQLAEGEYKFLLRVYTNHDEVSQDVVHVYVHSFVNPNQNLVDSFNYSNNVNISQNIIQIELDIEPSKFTERVKDEFINKFQLLFQQQPEFKVKQPKVILLNLKTSTMFKKSTVLLELLIIEDTIMSFESNKARIYNENSQLIKSNQNMVKSENLIKLLRNKRKSISIFDIFLLLVTSDDPKLIKTRYDYMNLADFQIVDIRQPICIRDDNVSINKCRHGKCDFYNNKCVCNKYWMPNLYKYYFGDDLTSGNNCDWNIPSTYLLGSIILIISIILLFKIIKCVFYYLCCCCCFGKNKFERDIENRKKSKKYVRSFRNIDDDSDDDTFLNETETSLINESLKQKIMKKSPFKKVAKGIKKIPNINRKDHKYVLLDNEEDDKKLKESLGRLKYNEDEEEIVYDQKMSSLNDSKNDGMRFKKYTNVI